MATYGPSVKSPNFYNPGASNNALRQGLTKGNFRPLLDPLSLFKHSSDTNPASDELAAMYRGEWSDYMARYEPEEQRQVDALSDRSNAQERTTAINQVGSTYARAPQQLQQQAFTSGLSLTPQDMASYGRRLNTEAGLASVDTANRVTRAQTDRAYGSLTPLYQPGGVGLNSTRGKVTS